MVFFGPKGIPNDEAHLTLYDDEGWGFSFVKLPNDGMRCCRSDWPLFVLLLLSTPCVVVDFCFIKFPILPPSRCSSRASYARTRTAFHTFSKTLGLQWGVRHREPSVEIIVFFFFFEAISLYL